jgi:hypothetical protein
MVAALGWVRGVLAGPVTGRDETPVTVSLARAESWAAAATRADWSSPPLRDVCETLGVRYWPPFQVEPGYAWGVCATLRWLTGTDQASPLPIPVRTPTGAVASGEQVYAALVAQSAGRVGLRERARLRREAGETAARSRYLAELVIDTATRAQA